jgi:hypothetical protein
MTGKGRPKAATLSPAQTKDLSTMLGHASDSTHPADALDTPAGLKRRRAASYRLPPLPDGRRDPLDPPPPRRRSPLVLSITTDSATGRALLRGNGSKQLAVDLGLTPRWSESGRGWLVDIGQVPDLIAFGEHQHYCVSWRERVR